MRYFMVLVWLLSLSTTAFAATNIWLTNGTTKIRQSVSPMSADSITIKGAKNEFEPFQLAIKTDSDMSNVDVSITNFVGPGTIPNSNVTIYKEEYLNITSLSTIEGQTGEWPDALLPKTDAYYHEARSTFPFSIVANRVQPIWFDVFIPVDTQPGNYTATVTVTANGFSVFTGSVNLTVWNFVLPATSSFQSDFKASPDHFWKGFSGATYIPIADMVAYQRDFIKAGLRHRISLSPYYMSWGSWNETDYDSLNTTNYNNSIAGYIDGTAPGIEYGASKISSLRDDFSVIYNKYVVTPGVLCKSGVTVPPSDMLYEVQKRAEKLKSTLTADQLNATYYLLIDEPGGGEVGCGASNPTLDYNSVKVMAEVIKNVGLKTFQTSSRKDELLNNAVSPARNDFINRWVPYFGSVVGRDYSGNFYDKTGDYAADLVNGTQLWWYQSCMTGGCGITGGASYNGNPHYYVEYSAMHSRIFPWMSYKYGVSGELYWSVGIGFGKQSGYTGDPYNSIWSSSYAKNGDGMLFYPGVVNTTTAGLPASDGRGTHTPSIGGTHNIPVESIRLKMIREGREDYEYLNMLKNQGKNTFAQTQISNLVTNTYTFVSDESTLYSVRESLAAEITGGVLNGSCGSSNGLALSSAPITGLCSAGTPSAVSGTGPWSWTCAGSGGGGTASCGATLLEAPPVGDSSTIVACPVIAGFR